MDLSELQHDALSEIFNVGAGRAAAALSEIVGDEVLMTVPGISFPTSSALTAELLSLSGDRLGSVRQSFGGPFAFDAALIFSERNALEIVREMVDSDVGVEDLVDFEQEAMCELGNIILNACVAAIGDMLQWQVDSTLPQYQVDRAAAIVSDLVADPATGAVLLLRIDLTMARHLSNGCLVFLLSSSSLTEFLAAVDGFVAGTTL